MQDAKEGGNRYKNATYGRDLRGFPLYNLLMHKRDYPDSAQRTMGRLILPAGYDTDAAANCDDFEQRRARTPPPTMVEEAIGIHCSKIYKTDPQREGPAALEAWWKNVDGKGTPMGQWMSETIAALFLCNGQVDLCFDHPPLPDGEIVNTRADEIRLGLTKCIASYVLPQNMLWWRLDAQGRYVECLVREPQEDCSVRFRHWTTVDSTLYECEFSKASTEENPRIDTHEVISNIPHPYGRPPIVRDFFRRRLGSVHVGHSPYESLACQAKEYYNRDSELILSDTTQAFPTLQAPADLLANGEIQVGPSSVLPMLECMGSDGQKTFVGFSYVDPPKGAADSIRLNKEDIRNEADRIACLSKPAGAATGSTVAQSGVSKVIDQSTGNDLLSKLSASLGRLEQVAAELALLVLGDGQVDPADAAAIKISYPKTFELADTASLGAAIQTYQGVLAEAGATPKTETRLIHRLTRLMLPGLDAEIYAELDDENEAFIESKSTTFSQEQEALHQQTVAVAQQTTKQAKQTGPSVDDPANDSIEED